MLRLMPVIFENYDCVQAIIANVLNYYNTPWQLMFIGAVGFEYIKLDDGGFVLHTGGQDEEVLNAIYGINELPVAAQSISELESSISNKDLICLYIDGFYCPWHNAFNNHHISHYLLAVGLNNSNNTVICADPFFTNDLKELPMKSVTFTEKNFVLRINNREISNINIIHQKSLRYLKYNINQLKNTRPYWEEINEFSSYLSLDGLRKELFDYQDSAFIEWLISLNFLSKSRKCFVESLCYLSQVYKISFERSINDFMQLSREWIKLKLCLLKYYYKKQYSPDVLQNIKLQIKALAEKEKVCIIRMSDFLNSL